MKFESYLISPMKKEGPETIQCDKSEAHFYTLFGIDQQQDAYYVGDFVSRGAARFVKDALEAS